MNSENSVQTPNFSGTSTLTVNGEPVEALTTPGVEYVYDTKRVFVLYSHEPDAKETKTRARKLKRAWEKVFGKDTCEVAIVDASDRVETLA